MCTCPEQIKRKILRNSTIFYRKKPNFMLHTTITIIHVEYQKLSINFIATLIEFFYLSLPGKNSNPCLIMHYYTTWVKNPNEATWKSSDWIGSIKILTDHFSFSLAVLCKIKQISNTARFINGTAPSWAMQRHWLKTLCQHKWWLLRTYSPVNKEKQENL